jgi:hypothetical protein
VIGLFGLAQAAAVLLALGLAWYGFRPSRQAQSTHLVSTQPTPSSSQGYAAPLLKVTIPSDGFPTVVEEGRLVVIHADSQPQKILVPIFSCSTAFLMQVEGRVPTVVDLTPDATAFGVDDWYLVFNAVESLANPVVVMKE